MTHLATMPLRRTEDLKVVELEGETLVYDLSSHRSHCLNGTAALVWRYCDGHTPVAEVAARLKAALPGLHGEDVVSLALKQLAQEGLLREGEAVVRSVKGITRRDLLSRAAKMGAAAAALPVVASLVAPGVAEAQSPSPTSTSAPAPTSTATPTSTPVPTSTPSPTATSVPTPTLTASPATVQGGAIVTVTWSGIPSPTGTATSGDWIGLYLPVSPNGTVVGGPTGGFWFYTGGGASGSRAFIMPTAPGTYEFRFLPNDGFVDIATSNSVTVTPAV